jgi:hypothetical protein
MQRHNIRYRKPVSAYPSIEVTMICGATFLLFLTLYSLALSSPTTKTKHGAKVGGVSSLDARCSRVGTDMVRKGGNAVDAVSKLLAKWKPPDADLSRPSPLNSASV